MLKHKKIIGGLMCSAIFLIAFSPSLKAASPTSANWFGIEVSPQTASVGLNYYYVGQEFTAPIEIQSNASTAANVWIDYDPNLIEVTQVELGSYFNSWAGQKKENGRIYSTGYNFPIEDSTGLGDFGTLQLKANRPSAANYQTNQSVGFLINTGDIGQTTQSNISKNGQDFLTSASNVNFYVWADTKKPYVKNFQPQSSSINNSVSSNILFELRDSLLGEGNDTGVGTGIDINSPGVQIDYSSLGGPETNLTNLANLDCSGLWGEICQVFVEPPLITSYAGDTRKWNYNTKYQVTIGGYRDLASPNQDQLGDPNGPNLMNSKTFEFTTEPDITAPIISSVVPLNDSDEQALNRAISFNITDRQSYPFGFSGSGVDIASCKLDISSALLPIETYDSNSPEVTVSPLDYGYRFEWRPVNLFSTDDTITVRIYDCADVALNKADDYLFIFSTLTSALLDQDNDLDGILNADDNCPNTPNTNQLDTDNDGLGDVCDGDIDNDGVANAQDNCLLIVNPQQEDIDNDGLGDVCDEDADSDGLINTVDNCPFVANVDQNDLDGDNIGDVCDEDLDGDTILNGVDNCLDVPNTDQSDEDSDGVGDLCDLEFGIKNFSVQAKPEKRATIAGVKNLSLDGIISFYRKDKQLLAWQDNVTLNVNGLADYSADQLMIGDYQIMLKGDVYLSKKIPNVSVIPSFDPIALDYTFGNTFELIAGDLYEDNRINAFDLSTMLIHYGLAIDHFTDLTKDERTNSFDIALLILNYLEKGESF